MGPLKRLGPGPFKPPLGPLKGLGRALLRTPLGPFKGLGPGPLRAPWALKVFFFKVDIPLAFSLQKHERWHTLAMAMLHPNVITYTPPRNKKCIAASFWEGCRALSLC